MTLDSYPILGIRILLQHKHMNDQYHIIHLFVGDNWKESARLVLPIYLGNSRIAFQTYHQSFDSSSTFWVHHPYFTLSSLSSLT